MTLVIRDPQPGSKELGYVRAALERGELVVLPTDTVYGIAAHATNGDACANLYAAKGRDKSQPIAVLLASLDDLDTFLPELSSRAYDASSALLPGPYTLIVGNPARRFGWLCGGTPGAIGVRVPADALNLPPVAATSANPSGQPEAARPGLLEPELLDLCAVAVDNGELPSGVASTVLDLTRWEASGDVTDIVVLRDPANRVDDAMALLGELVEVYTPAPDSRPRD